MKEVLQDTPPLETLKKNTDNRHLVLTLGERSNLKKKHYHKGEKKTGGLPQSNKTENTQSLNTDYEKKGVKFLSGVDQNSKTFPRTWEKPADYLKHLQVLKKTIFHLSRAWDEYQALFIEIRGTFSYVIKSFFSMIVGHPCYDIVPVASNLIQARFRTHKIQEKSERYCLTHKNASLNFRLHDQRKQKYIYAHVNFRHSLIHRNTLTLFECYQALTGNLIRNCIFGISFSP